jgi:transcriptional regulator with XRE-family HTH domain
MPTPKELKQWRQAAGLSQHQMAVWLKISRAQISHLENGKRLANASLIERYRKFIPN